MNAALVGASFTLMLITVVFFLAEYTAYTADSEFVYELAADRAAAVTADLAGCAAADNPQECMSGPAGRYPDGEVCKYTAASGEVTVRARIVMERAPFRPFDFGDSVSADAYIPPEGLPADADGNPIAGLLEPLTACPQP